MMRRGTVAEADVDQRDLHLMELGAALEAAQARIARLTDELDIANAARDRERKAKELAQYALRDTAADVAAMHDAALPRLAAIHPEPWDEPIPDDARVTRRGDWVPGTWPLVVGDRASDWGEVEPADFGPLYEEINGRLAGVAA